eukprot:TRINITY_DN859_c0_g1_i1.p1 TRINITY_DN859_c0_g1~~TRINITY_DN859_c0_g1_i1.p1  ORF type:complete len:358 (+),score=57.75 TRINITY_DN859_c0_g1_i1:1517-2590(+)
MDDEKQYLAELSSNSSGGGSSTTAALQTTQSSLAVEPRACPNCVRRRVRCELGVRPCANCSKDPELSQECLQDAAVLKYACFPCKKHRRKCDKKRPCTRCVQLHYMCVPYTTKETEIQSLYDVDKDGKFMLRTMPSANVESHPILSIPPCFWNSKEMLCFAQDFVQNVSPMQLYDSLHAPDARLQFFISALGHVLRRSDLLVLLNYVVDIVQWSFEGMDLEELRASLLKRAGEIPKRLEFTPDKPIVDIKPAGDLGANGSKSIAHCLEEFEAFWSVNFDSSGSCGPAWTWLEFDKNIGKTYSFVELERVETYCGSSVEDLVEMGALREKRDLEWLQKNCKGGQLGEDCDLMVTGWLT